MQPVSGSSPQIANYEIDKQIDLAVGQLAAKRHHAVAAVGDVIVYLLGVGVFMLARAKIRDYAAVFERLAFGLGAVTDGAVLTKQCSLVSAVVSDGNALRF